MLLITFIALVLLFCFSVSIFGFLFELVNTSHINFYYLTGITIFGLSMTICGINMMLSMENY